MSLLTECPGCDMKMEFIFETERATLANLLNLQFEYECECGCTYRVVPVTPELN